jgi:hypothetical protein
MLICAERIRIFAGRDFPISTLDDSFLCLFLVEVELLSECGHADVIANTASATNRCLADDFPFPPCF